MDDLAQKLSAMLNDPSTMAQVQSIMGALGSGNSVGQTAPAPPPAQPAVQQQPVPAAAPAAANPLGALAGLTSSGLNAETLGLVTRLAPMLSSIQQEDDSTRALRPLLGATRQKKLDEAIRLLQMMRMLPLLRQSGILGQLL